MGSGGWKSARPIENVLLTKCRIQFGIFHESTRYDVEVVLLIGHTNQPDQISHFKVRHDFFVANEDAKIFSHHPRNILLIARKKSIKTQLQTRS